MNKNYQKWLNDHLEAAKVRYTEGCRLDDEEVAAEGESTQYYEQAHQMFGYIAALEKCLRQMNELSGAESPKRATRPRR